MKLGTMAAIAALATAMTLGTNVTPADAGKKARMQAHQGGSSGQVHIDSKVSSKNLRAVSKQLKGHQKKAVMDEIDRRERKLSQRKYEKILGETLPKLPFESQVLFGLSAGASKGRGSGH